MSNFLKCLWPNPPEGYLSTWTKRNAIRFFRSTEFEEADAYMKAIAAQDDVYFTVALLERPAAHGRGSANDVSYLPCVHADFDLFSDQSAHAKTALPKSMDELRDFMAEVGIPLPSVMVHSGNGVHAYWLFHEPLDLRDQDRRAKAKMTLSSFQKTIIKLAKARRGWDFDNTGDLARVLRYPGTKNHKTKPPKKVEVM
ncbi:hypothetical protein GH983_00370 [Agrobacterium sp. MA01]|uniref:hypothetical protein n=1 Tax=Agrobacterium sp. MA01 TaxID=2664893 RepID=UPI00129ABDA6|nr:hypothetical protein [Agrobacterium sp. MA01]QGG89027.1 hypothetical protein GH983_00370 [Agrobacterium sp. MA01]